MEIKRIETVLCNMHRTTFQNMDGVCHIKALPYLSIVQAIEGSYSICLGDGETYETGEGGIFIAPSDVTQKITHHYNPVTDRMKARWVFLDTVINERFSMDFLYDYPVIIPKENLEQFHFLLDRLFDATHLCDQMSVCYQLVKELLNIASEKTFFYNETMLRAVHFIKTHYRENISIAQLAGLSNMSESNFYAVFRKNFRQSPISFLNDYRLSVASDLLIHTDKTIKEISCEVGIPDQLYFSKQFKRKYLISPQKYRRTDFF